MENGSIRHLADLSELHSGHIMDDWSTCWKVYRCLFKTDPAADESQLQLQINAQVDLHQSPDVPAAELRTNFTFLAPRQEPVLF